MGRGRPAPAKILGHEPPSPRVAGAPREVSDPGVGSTEPGLLGRAHLLWLGALTLLAVFLVLEPLGTFALFGSDTGEYFRLTSDLVATGRIPTTGYGGWGTAYPDFPGIFLLAGATAGALGTDVLGSLLVAVPVVAALSVLPLFLLFRRLLPTPTLALLGAGFASVFMPRAFSIAHPAPLSLGDFLAVAGLWLFIEGRRDSRYYLPLALTVGALIVTHHLSSYFFLVSALGGLLLLELWRPGSWSGRFPLRELVFLGGFATVLLVYWFVYAPAFLGVLRTGFPGLASTAVVPAAAIAILGVVLVGGLVRWRRARPHPRPSFRYPSDRSVARDLAIIFAGILAGLGAIVFVPVPGTMQRTVLAAILFFLPLLATAVFAAGSRRLVTSSRLGPFAITWVSALGVSTLVALASANAELPAERHVEYLVIPLGLLVAVGLGHLVGRWVTPRGRPAMVAAGLAVALALGANAAIVYPPPADFGGFQEGLTPEDAALWLWAGVGLPEWATVASDHRLSSMIFGFDGNPATWDSTPNLFTGDSWPSAAAELARTYAPHDLRPVNAVAVDQTMFGGVALDPSANAQPISPEAASWLGEPPFVPLYENGPQVVYWVAGPVPTAP